MMIMSNTQHLMHYMLKALFVLVVFGVASTAFAASLSLSPATGVYTSGQTFSATVLVNTNGKAINAADGTVSFDPNQLAVVGVSKGPIFSLWTADPSFSNSAGTVSFSGGTPTGYTGGAGSVVTITFRAKGSGPTKVNFSKGSVLAADGLGTNVLNNMAGGNYTISAAAAVPEPETIIEYVPAANTPGAPKVTSATHPDPAMWYKSDRATLSWSLPSGITAVRTLLDNAPSSIPSKVYAPPINEIDLEGLEEGEQYFHIQYQNADGWGRITHYRLAVDATAPSDLSLTLADDADLSSPNQTILVSVTEETSGIARYNVQLDGGEPVSYDETGSSTIELRELEPGHHTVVVEAFDKAGNSTIANLSFSVQAFDKPQFTEYPAEINEEVIPVIKGQTRPRSAVQVTVTQVGLGSSRADAEQVYDVRSDDKGIFTIIPAGTFSLGVYELVAVAIDEHGAQSEPSDPIRIAVQKPGYLQIGSLAVSILSVLVPIIALCALLILGVWYLVVVMSRMRRGVEKEAAEALTILRKEFSSIQSELEAHVAKLAGSRKTNKLTKAEAEVIDAISTSLRESRQRVEKEIADVEDVVD